MFQVRAECGLSFVHMAWRMLGGWRAEDQEDTYVHVCPAGGDRRWEKEHSTVKSDGFFPFTLTPSWACAETYCGPHCLSRARVMSVTKEDTKGYMMGVGASALSPPAAAAWPAYLPVDPRTCHCFWLGIFFPLFLLRSSFFWYQPYWTPRV
jgi:hypothetical protein